jgi:ParB family chromosome partitioning protein
MNDIEMIPLGKLRLSEANVRKNDSNLFIEELAANIEAKGLLQNLIVAPAKKRGMFDVTAGGRRLRALNFFSRRASCPRITLSPAASSTSMPPSSPSSR